MRILVIVVSVIVIVGYYMMKWKRTSSYVDERNSLYRAQREKEDSYTQRAKQDSRWSGFMGQMQSRCSVTDGPAQDDDTYQVHYINIMDQIQKQYEPGDPGAENASIYAFLKRKAKPKYLQFELTPGGEIIQRKISGGQWYDLFEKSV